MAEAEEGADDRADLQGADGVALIGGQGGIEADGAGGAGVGHENAEGEGDDQRPGPHRGGERAEDVARLDRDGAAPPCDDAGLDAEAQLGAGVLGAGGQTLDKRAVAALDAEQAVAVDLRGARVSCRRPCMPLSGRRERR